MSNYIHKRIDVAIFCYYINCFFFLALSVLLMLPTPSRRPHNPLFFLFIFFILFFQEILKEKEEDVSLPLSVFSSSYFQCLTLMSRRCRRTASLIHSMRRKENWKIVQSGQTWTWTTSYYIYREKESWRECCTIQRDDINFVIRRLDRPHRPRTRVPGIVLFVFIHSRTSCIVRLSSHVHTNVLKFIKFIL